MDTPKIEIEVLARDLPGYDRSPAFDSTAVGGDDGDALPLLLVVAQPER